MKAKGMILILAAILLSGCVMRPAEATIPPVHFEAGEIEVRPTRLTLYFSAPGQRLIAETREVNVSPVQSRVGEAMKQLLAGPVTSGLNPILPEDTAAPYIEISRNIACIYFADDFRSMDADERLSAHVAIVNTICGIDDINYVSVFAGSHELGSDDSLLGPMTTYPNDLFILKARLENTDKINLQRYRQEEDTQEPTPTIAAGMVPAGEVPVNDAPAVESDAAKSASPADGEPDAPEQDDDAEETLQKLMLYYMDKKGRFLSPEIQTLHITRGRYIETIITQLSIAPLNGDDLAAPLSENVSLESPPLLREISGKTVLEINFNTSPYQLSGEFSRNQTLAYAAVTYSLLNALPGIDEVVYLIDNVRVSELGATGKSAANGFNREDFHETIGSIIRLYFALHNTSFITETSRIVRQSESMMAETRLNELIAGPDGNSADCWPIFPRGISEKDILRIWAEDDMIIINFSENFKQACSSLDEISERQMVYSIVNTITEIPGINRVWFKCEGQPLVSLAGTLTYEKPFLRNPGIKKT